MPIKQMQQSQEIVDEAVEYAAETMARNTPEYQALVDQSRQAIQAGMTEKRAGAAGPPTRETVPMKMSNGAASTSRSAGGPWTRRK